MAPNKSSMPEPGRTPAAPESGKEPGEKGKAFRAKFNCAAFFLLSLVAFGIGLLSPWGFLVPAGMIGMAVSLGALAYYYL